MLFDLNDFDETSNAPWEWDVKRFAASIVLGGRDNGFADERCREITEAAVGVYRTTLHELFEMTALERYYFHIDTDWLERQTREHARLVRKTVGKARRRTSDQVLDKMTTTTAAGEPRIKDMPPVTRHVDYVTADELAGVFEQYRTTLRADTAVLLSQFRLVDYVLRVVGVGSVGTRCYVALFVARPVSRCSCRPRRRRRRCWKPTAASGAASSVSPGSIGVARATGSSPVNASCRRTPIASSGGSEAGTTSVTASHRPTSTSASSAT
jgi:uncharacterized protein (DUF2252 family)